MRAPTSSLASEDDAALPSRRTAALQEHVVRELSALRAIAGAGEGVAVVVADMAHRRLVWTSECLEALLEESELGCPAWLVASIDHRLHGSPAGKEPEPSWAGLVVRSCATMPPCSVFNGPQLAAALVVNTRHDEAGQDGWERRLRRLSKRERDVLKLLLAGYSRVNIAAICTLSPHTVRTYIGRIYHKLGVSSRGEILLEFAHRPNLHLHR